jgi:TetR/AcrR family transcriptional regulator, cholesterol catabolism regulator
MTAVPGADSRPARRAPGENARPGRAQRVAILLDKAADVFFERGFNGTSMRDIAEATGLLKGSLYHYFDSKSDLLYEIIKPAYDAALANVRPLADPGGQPLEQLAAFVRAHVRYVSVYQREHRIRVRDFPFLSPQRRAELSEVGDVYYGAVRRVLRAGQERGAVDAELDIRLTALMIVGQLNSMTEWYRPGGQWSAAALGARMAGLTVASVASDSAVASYGGTDRLRAAFAE